MLSDILDFASLLSDLKFKIVRRERNQVAHELAQLVKRPTHTAVWRTHVRSCCVKHLVTHVYNC
jgi:hypothetical protein